METTHIYNLVILDESGSMEDIKNVAITGCNETIQGIRAIQRKHNETQRHFLSLVSFNSDNATKILYDKTPIDTATDLNPKSYCPDCCTPLYDAMGLSFNHLQNTIDKSNKYCVLVTIITDGMENSSTIFNAAKINSLVNELKLSGWTFAYIGANQDVVAEARKMGINNSMSYEANEMDTNVMFKRMSKARYNYAQKMSEGATCEELNEKLFEYEDEE